MKPFQFYASKEMPELKPGQSVSNHVQMTFSGEGEDVKTTFTLKAKNYEESLSLFRVESGIKHDTVGYIKTVIGEDRQKIEFFEYLELVDFQAYLDKERGLMIFQAPKKVCRGVLAHLRSDFCGIELGEMEVDFTKVIQLKNEYLGAWFKQVSARIQASALFGTQIQEDTLFKRLSQEANLSNVTIPWIFGGAEHHVMITSRGGVVLLQNYQGNIGLELKLVMDVQENLLEHVWHEKGSKVLEDETTEEPEAGLFND